MRSGRLAILALVVLALAAYIYFVERHTPTTDELKERTNKLFPTLDQAKVQRLVITNTHGRFELAKEKDDWKLKAPLADDANEGAVTSLLGSLTSLGSERTLEAKDVKLADYGLDKPPLQLQAFGEGGISTQLKLGREMPLGTTRAALTAGDKVYLINKYIATDLDKDLAGWRSDQLVRVNSGEVAAANITYSGVRVAVAHTGSTWTLTEPVTDLADRERAEGLINDLAAARIKEFVDTPPALATLGLEPRRIEVTLVRRGGNSAPIVLQFGNERDVTGAKQVACKRADRVFWVEATAIKGLQGKPSDWRAGKLVQLDTWSADSFELEAGGAKALIERKDGVWRAGAVEVDFTTVSNRLNTLSSLEVAAFDQPKPTGQALGKVKVAVSGGAAVEAAFYPGIGPAQTLAVVVGRPGALAVDRAKVNDLLADPVVLTKAKPTPTPMPSPTATKK
jgi:hypothetical protein